MIRASLCLAAGLAAMSIGFAGCAPSAEEAAQEIEQAADEAAADVDAAATEAAAEVEEAMSGLEEAAGDLETAADDAATEAAEAAAGVEPAVSDLVDGVDGALSGEAFIAQGAALSGTTVVLERCSLFTEPLSDGSVGCRVVDEDGNDLMDPRGLPVDVFFSLEDVGSGGEAWIAEHCPDSFCTVRLSGDLTVEGGTDYRRMTNVTLSQP